MPRLKLNTLKAIKIRQNWNKYNVYNLSRQTPQQINRSFYQQKYAAKSETRNYHGEHLTERKWNDMFVRSMRGVMPMDPVELGASDGRGAAMGRGSGLDGSPVGDDRKIPFLHGMFAPIERRLDTAIFRAMFSSSVRQARNFVVHGRVKVNGKKLQHPGYMLNPGDMFSVDPDLVMFATGAPKPSKADAKTRREALRKQYLATKEANAKKPQPVIPTGGDASAQFATAAAAVAAAVPEGSKKSDPTPTAASGTPSQTDTEALEKPEKEEEPKYDDGVFDPTKPYYTPWKPRDFLNVFAYIPRYLEVNHNICHAVYLRHPVARKGECEVPTPFSQDTMQLAHAWYLRRR